MFDRMITDKSFSPDTCKNELKLFHVIGRLLVKLKLMPTDQSQGLQSLVTNTASIEASKNTSYLATGYRCVYIQKNHTTRKARVE